MHLLKRTSIGENGLAAGSRRSADEGADFRMTYMTRKFLADVDLLASLPEEVLDDLVHRGATLTTPPGGTVVEQGSDSAGLQIILEGSAEVSAYGKYVRTIESGDYFGEISMIDGSPRSATVVAGPDGVTTYALSSLAFAPVIAENPAVARTLLVSLCARLRTTDALAAEGTGETACADDHVTGVRKGCGDYRCPLV